MVVETRRDVFALSSVALGADVVLYSLQSVLFSPCNDCPQNFVHREYDLSGTKSQSLCATHHPPTNPLIPFYTACFHCDRAAFLSKQFSVNIWKRLKPFMLHPKLCCHLLIFPISASTASWSLNIHPLNRFPAFYCLQQNFLQFIIDYLIFFPFKTYFSPLFLFFTCHPLLPFSTLSLVL
ncbi:hypothetical protein ILYODFUR_033245 [Ilyodon furcidens]|uniref:Uncharacterized protein n=1 Tax=Ilyodon furcidens TaxID=33524 RepID=A0ABV0V070_9TELE